MINAAKELQFTCGSTAAAELYGVPSEWDKNSQPSREERTKWINWSISIKEKGIASFPDNTITRQNVLLALLMKCLKIRATSTGLFIYYIIYGICPSKDFKKLIMDNTIPAYTKDSPFISLGDLGLKWNPKDGSVWQELHGTKMILYPNSAPGSADCWKYVP